MRKNVRCIYTYFFCSIALLLLLLLLSIYLSWDRIQTFVFFSLLLLLFQSCISFHRCLLSVYRVWVVVAAATAAAVVYCIGVRASCAVSRTGQIDRCCYRQQQYIFTSRLIHNHFSLCPIVSSNGECVLKFKQSFFVCMCVKSESLHLFGLKSKNWNFVCSSEERVEEQTKTRILHRHRFKKG